MNAEKGDESKMGENAKEEDRNGETEESAKIDRIRDVLFGSQMRDYDNRLQRLDERLAREAAEARADLQKRLEALENALKGEVESVSNHLNAERLERRVAIEKLARGLAETARALDLKLRKLDEQAAREIHNLRRQLLEQTKVLSEEIQETAEKQEQMEADLNRETAQLRGAMTGREAMAEMLSEVALRKRQRNGFHPPPNRANR
jgi:methyl-accepting chemotaxis protein